MLFFCVGRDAPHEARTENEMPKLTITIETPYEEVHNHIASWANGEGILNAIDEMLGEEAPKEDGEELSWPIDFSVETGD